MLSSKPEDLPKFDPKTCSAASVLTEIGFTTTEISAMATQNPRDMVRKFHGNRCDDLDVVETALAADSCKTCRPLTVCALGSMASKVGNAVDLAASLALFSKEARVSDQKRLGLNNV